MKTIKIGSQEFNISCHASTYRDYADIFDRNIMKDLQTAQNFVRKEIKSLEKHKEDMPNASVQEIQEMIFEDTLDDLNDFIDCITRMCWICIYDNNKDIDCYEEWYNSLERLSLSDNWIMEVMALCADCFR
ncbi:MAG TPA: hypothetical protein IAB45_03555 [Candidatus Onthousia faecavium]|nr:hypothetical protein [Candidatus Onthousia faecavium]